MMKLQRLYRIEVWNIIIFQTVTVMSSPELFSDTPEMDHDTPEMNQDTPEMDLEDLKPSFLHHCFSQISIGRVQGRIFSISKVKARISPIARAQPRITFLAKVQARKSSCAGGLSSLERVPKRTTSLARRRKNLHENQSGVLWYSWRQNVYQIFYWLWNNWHFQVNVKKFRC